MSAQGVISTRDVRPREKLGLWQDTLAQLFGKLGSDTQTDASFGGKIEHATIGDVRIARITASPHRVVRTPNHARREERVLSNQDIRHRLVGNFTADAPQTNFLRNFSFSGILTLKAPRPFTIFVGKDINKDTNPVTDRVGLSPRNSYLGDHLYNMDLRLSRAIHLKENRKLDLVFDAFNVFNRQNVNEVTSVHGGGTIDFCGAAPTQY
jgi:hypothetical protein